MFYDCSIPITINTNCCPKKSYRKRKIWSVKKNTKESVIEFYGKIIKSEKTINTTSHHDSEMELIDFNLISLAKQIPFQMDDANEIKESDRNTVLNETRTEYK